MVQDKTIGRTLFIALNYAFCIIVAIICIMPVVHVLAVSFSSKHEVFSGHVYFWPMGFTTANYQMVVGDAQFFRSYFVSFQRVLLGWFVNLSLTVLVAYPMCLKKSIFPARNFIMWYFVVTMFFNGGMIPTYLVVDATGIIDTMWALVLPTAVPIFNVILMKNFMKGIPESLMESAHIDGASHFTTLLRIMIPLSKASIATISLFSMLFHWNEWFQGMIYIRKASLKPLQTYLRSIIIVSGTMTEGQGTAPYLEDLIDQVTRDATDGAKIFLALIPIICVYPFLQKHFAKGIIVGSVKG